MWKSFSFLKRYQNAWCNPFKNCVFKRFYSSSKEHKQNKNEWKCYMPMMGVKGIGAVLTAALKTVEHPTSGLMLFLNNSLRVGSWSISRSFFRFSWNLKASGKVPKIKRDKINITLSFCFLILCIIVIATVKLAISRNKNRTMREIN